MYYFIHKLYINTYKYDISRDNDDMSNNKEIII